MKQPLWRYIFGLLASTILAAWVAVGRMLFGAGGWLVFLTLFIIGPGILIGFIWLLVLDFYARSGGRHLSASSRRWLGANYSGIALGSLMVGCFIVDGGDTKASINSVFTAFMGSSYQGLSDVLTFTGAILVALGLVGALIILTTNIVRHNKPSRAIIDR